MSRLSQEIRNAYDLRSRDMLEHALRKVDAQESLIKALTPIMPPIKLAPDGVTPVPPEDSPA